MIFWLAGLAFVILYSCFRRPVEISPLVGALVGIISYAVFGLLIFIVLIFTVAVPFKGIRDPSAVGCIAAFIKIGTIVAAAYASTRIHTWVVSRKGRGLRKAEPAHPA